MEAVIGIIAKEGSFAVAFLVLGYILLRVIDKLFTALSDNNNETKDVNNKLITVVERASAAHSEVTGALQTVSTSLNTMAIQQSELTNIIDRSFKSLDRNNDILDAFFNMKKHDRDDPINVE